MGAHRLISQEPAASRRILIVDDEASVLSDIGTWLRREGMTYVCARSVAEAVRLAAQPGIGAAIVDYRLSEGDQGVALGSELRRKHGLPFVLISGFLETAITVEAMRAGAVDVVEKPLRSWRLISAVERALLQGFRRPAQGGVASSVAASTPESVTAFGSESITRRWANFVLAACLAQDDPRTLELWGRSIGVSAGTIEESCRLCNVQPHNARDLGRFLRALSLSRLGDVPLRNHFAVADERTFERLFARAGVAVNAVAMPLAAFLRSQTFVATSAPCLRELGHLAANSPYFRL